MGRLQSVNIGVPHPSDAKGFGFTGIDKRPTTDSVMVCGPGPRGQGSGSGLAGDQVFDAIHHQGDDRAVCVYAREDLDWWENELGRSLPDGIFGENFTTTGIDVTGALLDERWLVGEQLVLELAQPRNPCVTFNNWMPEHGWLKRFTTHAAPGAFFRVITPGPARVGDTITVLSRPSHDVTVGLAFRALTRERNLQPRLAAVEHLSDDISNEKVSTWAARVPDFKELIAAARRERSSL